MGVGRADGVGVVEGGNVEVARPRVGGTIPHRCCRACGGVWRAAVSPSFLLHVFCFPSLGRDSDGSVGHPEPLALILILVPNCPLIPLPLAKSDLVLGVNAICSRQVDVVTMCVWTPFPLRLKSGPRPQLPLLPLTSPLKLFFSFSCTCKILIHRVQGRGTRCVRGARTASGIQAIFGGGGSTTTAAATGGHPFSVLEARLDVAAEAISRCARADCRPLISTAGSPPAPRECAFPPIVAGAGCVVCGPRPPAAAAPLRPPLPHRRRRRYRRRCAPPRRGCPPSTPRAPTAVCPW